MTDGQNRKPRSGWAAADGPGPSRIRRLATRALDGNTPFPPASLPFFYGWVILVASTCGVVASIPGQTMGVSVFTDIFIHELDLSRVHLSLAYLIGTVASGFLVTFGGRLFDRYGARLSVIVNALLFGCVLLAMGQIDRIAGGLASPFPAAARWGIVFTVAVCGFFAIRFLGQGMLTVISRAMLGKWFDKRRGLAFAISGVVGSFAFAAAPPFLDTLNGLFGWRGAYGAMAMGAGFGMAVLGWAFFRDNPEECGLRMDGGPVETPAETARRAPPIVRDWTLDEVVRTLTYWAFNLGTAWFALLTTAYAFHVISIGQYAGIDKDTVLGLFLPMAFVGVVSNFLAGWLSDRVAMRWILLGLLAGVCTGSLGMFWLGGPVGKALLIAGIGLAGGCFQTCLGVTWPRFYGRGHVGAISGFNMSTIVIGSALGPFLFSVSEHLTGDYQAAFLLSAIATAMLMIPAWLARNPQRAAAPASDPNA